MHNHILFTGKKTASLSIICVLWLSVFLASSLLAAEPPDDIRALYVPANRISQKMVTELVHYSGQLPVNAAVLHVKDPFGRLAWSSGHPYASEIKDRA